MYTDIALGSENGFCSILVLSGESTIEDMEKSIHKPEYVYKSLEDITNELIKIYNI
ncbi:MAG TPA: HAD hydrolase-like protein [Clostridia bacterium]|nr:HAD hydrolase-like protein [Clostridia bacterium]